MSNTFFRSFLYSLFLFFLFLYPLVYTSPFLKKSRYHQDTGSVCTTPTLILWLIEARWTLFILSRLFLLLVMTLWAICYVLLFLLWLLVVALWTICCHNETLLFLNIQKFRKLIIVIILNLWYTYYIINQKKQQQVKGGFLYEAYCQNKSA